MPVEKYICFPRGNCKLMYVQKGAELYIMHRKPVLRKVERTTEKCTEIFTLTQCIVTSGDTMEGNAAQEL